MASFENSTLIKESLRKGFEDGTSKMAQRKCYGYAVNQNGELKINSKEAEVVRFIFDSYADGQSLGKIADDLEQKKILSPSGRPRWSREAINKLLSNEKYTGRVLLQKTISIGFAQIKNDGLEDRFLLVNHHERIISDEQFRFVQKMKQARSKSHEMGFDIDLMMC